MYINILKLGIVKNRLSNRQRDIRVSYARAFCKNVKEQEQIGDQ